MQIDACNPSAELLALALAAFGLACLLASRWLKSALKQRILVRQLREMEDNADVWRRKYEIEAMWRSIIDPPRLQLLLSGPDQERNQKE